MIIKKFLIKNATINMFNIDPTKLVFQHSHIECINTRKINVLNYQFLF